jgi:hypothetical protein
MFRHWIPWKFLLQRTARSFGVLDPITFLARLRSFAQPSEIQEPIELLRAGITFHARGLINTRAIQHNLDWVWPYWVEKQFDPNDVAFLPRAFSFNHVNLTHRNWTAVGRPDLPLYPIVDPRGLVTPLYDGWSLDFWVVSEDGKKLLPSKLPQVEQRLNIADNLMVTTDCRLEDLTLNTSVSIETCAQKICLVIGVQADSASKAWAAVSVRPYNPEGIQFVEAIEVDHSRRQWRINSETTIRMSDVPEQILFSNYAEGDVLHKIGQAQEGEHVTCDVGMATSAALFRLSGNEAKALQVAVYLDEELRREGQAPRKKKQSWSSSLKPAARLAIPDARIQFLYEAAVRTLILLSAGEVVPGPYTYRRFWFRDACFMLNAMLTIGLKDRCRRLLEAFFRRQKRSGYFLSQSGEWDSNGQVLWIFDRFQKLTGHAFSKDWQKAVFKGAEWIKRKRISSTRSERHAGLLPPGFSAEHFGPNDYYYWDDFWALAGLRSAARLAGEFDAAPKQREFSAEAQNLEKTIFKSIAAIPEAIRGGAIPASPYRRMDAGAVGSLVADYPLQITAPGDGRIIKTAEFLLANCFHAGGFFQDIVHSGINPYLTLCIAQTFLRNGDLRWRDLVKTVADSASTTGQWPEAVHPRTGGGCMGDGQHGWAAAEWVMMMRNLFVREEKDKIVIGAGIFPQWLQSGARIGFGPTLTPFGSIRVNIDNDNNVPHLQLDTVWIADPAEVQIQIPGYKKQTITDFNRAYRLREIAP